jgi:hypothetical protein
MGMRMVGMEVKECHQANCQNRMVTAENDAREILSRLNGSGL